MSTQGENYCLSEEPWCPNINLSSDVFFSHCLSLLPLFNRATQISEIVRNSVTFFSGLITVWALCISGSVHLCECFLPDRVGGVSKKEHGKNTLAYSLRYYLTHSILHPAHHFTQLSHGQKPYFSFTTNAQNGINHTVSKHS